MKEYQSPGLHRGGVLGQRVLCFDGRFGRGHGTGIHPASRERGRARRPDAARRLASRLQAAHGVSAPLRRSPNKPPALPGVS